MAPQLIFEEKPIYSIKCDVWSLGVVMYYVRKLINSGFVWGRAMEHKPEDEVIPYVIEAACMFSSRSVYIGAYEKLDIKDVVI